MEKIRLSLVLSVLLFSGACQKRTLYREFQQVNNYVWNQSEQFLFQVPIKQTNQTANIYFTVRHVGEYPFDNLPIKVIITNPAGKTETLDKDVNLKNDKGEFKGDVAGNLYDVEEILWKDFVFVNTGTYTITLTNTIERERIPGLVDIGIKVTLP